MTFLVKAPALVVLAAWSLALTFLGRGLPPGAVVAAALLAPVGLLLLGSDGFEGWAFRPALLVLLLSLGGAVLFLHRLAEPSLPPRYEGEVTVLSERSWGKRRLVVVEGGGLRLAAFVPPRQVVGAGSHLDVEGEVLPLRKAREGESFDFSRWARARGIEGELRPGRWRLLDGKSGWAWRRARIEAALLLKLPPLMRGHLLAAWTGGRDPDLARAHRRWGTSHLLAVSGFHVGLVASAILLFAGPSTVGLVVASALVWAYVFLAGAPASAVRAALMVQLYLQGRQMGRRGGGVNAVALAGLILLAWRPWWFWDVGWRLSMTAVLTLTALPDWGKGTAFLAGPLVWLTTAPVAAEVFGVVPLAGIVLNLVALPLFAFLLPLASLAALPVLAGWRGGAAAARFGEDLFALWARAADGAANLLVGEVTFSALIYAAGTFVLFLLLARKVGVGPPRSLAAALALTLFCATSL